MKFALAVALSLVSLFGAFLLGRLTAPAPAEVSDIESFRQALDDPDWLTRSRRMTAFLETLSPENLPEAVAALEPHLPWLDTDEMRQFMLAWSRFDPPGALRQALAWPPQYRRVAAGGAIYSWAFRDPEAALEALRRVDVPELDEFLEGRLVAGWAHGPHWQGASEFVASLPEGPRRFGYIGTLAWERSKQGPDAVRTWAESVPDLAPRYKAAVFLKSATTLAAIDPVGTASWIAEHLERDYAEGALRVVARAWAASDPPAAFAWLVTLPAGQRRTSTVAQAFRVWHDRSPAEAERWLRAATPAGALDPAVRVMVGRKRQSSPDDAIEWAMAIDDPGNRQAVVSALVAESSGAGSRATLPADPPTAP